MGITGAQIRASRAFLRWTLADLATASGIATSTLQLLEKEDGEPAIMGGGVSRTLQHRQAVRANAVAKVQAALELAGITFLPETSQGAGIRGLA